MRFPKLYWAAAENADEDYSWPQDSGRETALFLVLEGQMKIEVDGKTWHPSAGDLMIVPALLPHQIHIWGGSSALTVTFVPDDFSFDDSPRIMRVGTESLVEHIMKDLVQLWYSRELHHEVNGALLVALLSYLQWIEKREIAAKALHPGVAAAVEAIERNLTTPLTIKELAQEAHLSVGHLQAMFRAQIGCSPLHYRQELRLQRACLLLEQTDLSVQQIAAQCGYVDVEYFGRAFKRTYRATPLRWRSNKKQQAH
jgi:transcriptional regulator GlxA family with amidase domain